MFFKKSKPKPDAARPQTATDMERPALAPEDKKMWVDGRNPHRTLTGDAAMALRPGDAHYKAYVGPPRRFDFMGATQFALLFHMGLRDHHTVLDFGCGSLRLGRSLIPYLQAGGYFGIDPNKWLIEDGIENELGQDGIQLKRPRFAYNTDFDCSIFGEKFDYIIAQSIFTHCGPNHFETFLERAAQALKPDGIVLFTYNKTPDDNTELPPNGWHYPECVTYQDGTVQTLVERSPLVGKTIPWYHPASQWYAAALTENHLPADAHLSHLTGAVLRQEQFKASLSREM